MALIEFYRWLFTKVLGVFGFEATLPYGWAWLLSQATLILALTVVLLVMLAFLLLFDRKIWAAVQSASI